MTLNAQQSTDRAVLAVSGLHVAYLGEGGAATPVVQGVSLTLNAGRIHGLVGESGCGKSTVSLALMGLLTRRVAQVGGEVQLGDAQLLQLSPRQLRQLQGSEISMIFQEPMSSLNPAFTIGRQVCEPMLLHLKLSKTDASERAAGLLRRVGIANPEHVMRQYPHELSGGMRQRAMIAMAMSCRPKVLIADEPTTALDVTTQAQILELIRELCEEEETAVLLITHDLGVVAETCDEVTVMYAGEVVEHVADKAELFRRPLHPYTRGLLASLPEANRGATFLPVIAGTVPRPGEYGGGCRFASRCAFRTDVCLGGPVPLDEVSTGRQARCVRISEITEIAA